MSQGPRAAAISNKKVTGKFETMSHISASPSDATYPTGVSPIDFPSFTQNFEVIFIYGRTEFKAQLAWKEHVSLL